jgi:hypothetical protein
LASVRRLARRRMVEGRCVGTFFLRGIRDVWITESLPVSPKDARNARKLGSDAFTAREG